MTTFAKTLLFTRRAALLGGTAMLLAACSDNGGTETAAENSATTDAITTSATVPDPAGTVDATKLLEAGALPEMVMGEATAPVTIVEYASMTCGHCAAFHADTFKALKEQYVDTGKVRFIFREFPFDPLAEAAFMLARCSEDRYFAMVDALFATQRTWARAEKPSEALFQISRQAGFTEASFNACLTNSELLGQIREVRRKGAEDYAVDSTPTLFVNGKRYPGNMPIEQLSAIIEAEM